VIDDRLILEAQKLGNHRTKKDTVTTALVEYIRRRKQANIVSSFGTIDYDPSYDYKRELSRHNGAHYNAAAAALAHGRTNEFLQQQLR
jgi:hypothetical protein